ncbi:MAG: leucine-rich repeat protein [Firmicutes bacterium]|nr:leucine-rich repeat protein [Bacillota bacterium]
MRRTIVILLSLVLLLGVMQPSFAAGLYLEEQYAHLADENGLVIVDNRLILCMSPEEWSKERPADIDIVIPDGVTAIGDEAFMWQGKIRSIRIPETVTSIGAMAFYCCGGLKEIDIPASVIHMGPEDDKYNLSDVFYMCDSMERINVDPGNTVYRDIDGVLFRKDGTELLVFPPGRTGEYAIPEGVSRIEENAFNNCGLSSLTVPEGVTVLDGLSMCNELKSLTLPGSLTKIEDYGIYECPYLSDIYYAGTQAEWNRIEKGSTLPDLSKVTIHYGSAPAQPAAPASEPAPAPSAGQFVDVPAGSWYADAVKWAFDNGVTDGVDASHFGPDRTVTRGQAVTFLWRAMGCPEPEGSENPFEDVAADMYYYKPVLWAVEKGITDGTDAAHFAPSRTCSTAHIITFLYRTLGIGEDGWYEKAAAWAEENGLLSDTGFVTAPGVNCPRAAVVTFLYRELD